MIYSIEKKEDLEYLDDILYFWEYFVRHNDMERAKEWQETYTELRLKIDYEDYFAREEKRKDLDRFIYYEIK